MTRQQSQFCAFIDALALPNFSGREMLPYFDRVRAGVNNSMPPRELWPNIVPTLVVAQAIRNQVGPLVITSSYRSPDYNRAVGGERQSYHMSFDALDLVPKAATVAQLHRAAVSMRGKRFRNPFTGKSFTFAGGIGKYPGFVHIDDRGVNANW